MFGGPHLPQQQGTKDRDANGRRFGSVNCEAWANTDSGAGAVVLFQDGGEDEEQGEETKQVDERGVQREA